VPLCCATPLRSSWLHARSPDAQIVITFWAPWFLRQNFHRTSYPMPSHQVMHLDAFCPLVVILFSLCHLASNYPAVPRPQRPRRYFIYIHNKTFTSSNSKNIFTTLVWQPALSPKYTCTSSMFWSFLATTSKAPRKTIVE
jgi:hypothetical protein